MLGLFQCFFLSGSSPTFDMNPDPGNLYGSGGSRSATLKEKRFPAEYRDDERLMYLYIGGDAD